MQGDNAEEYVRREIISSDIISVETYEEAMKLLESGKHDAVVAQRLMGLQLLKNLGISEIVPVEHKLDKFRQEFSFAVQEGDKGLLADLNEGLSIVMTDGTFERLHEKWFMPILGRQMSSQDVFKYSLIIGVPFILVTLLAFNLVLRSELKRKTKGLNREIEVRERTAKELMISEIKYRDIVEGTNDLITRVSKHGEFLFVNNVAERIFGLSVDECIGRQAFQFIHPDDRAATEKWFNDCIQKKLLESTVENRQVNQINGKVYHLLWISKFTYDEDDQVMWINGIARDVTERKRAEQKAQKEVYLRSVLLDNLPCIALILKKKTYEIVASNEVARKIGAVPGKTCFQTCADRDNPCPFCRAPELWAKGEPQEKDVIYRGKYYRGIWVPFSDDLYVHYIFDVTDRMEAEAAREVLNKELSQIINITSHDLRTPIVNVKGYSKLLDNSVKELKGLLDNKNVPLNIREKTDPLIEKELPESLHYISNSIAKMDALLEGMSKLSRTGRIELIIEEIDMNEIVSDVINNFSNRLNETGIKVEVGELPSCRGDRNQINQIFSNLVDNALKYMDPERAGIIKISGNREGYKPLYCVEDNGIGIAPKNQIKIFDIFHRLDPEKSAGEGLGLAIVHKILNRLGGKVWVESEIGKGSKFFVSLPAYS